MLFNLYARIATEAEKNALDWQVAANWMKYASLPEGYYDNNPSVQAHKQAPQGGQEQGQGQGQGQQQNVAAGIIVHPIYKPTTQMFEGQQHYTREELKVLIEDAIQATRKRSKIEDTGEEIDYAATADYGENAPITDHYGIVAKGRNILTQNVLTRCRFDAKNKFFNNGFKIVGEFTRLDENNNPIYAETKKDFLARMTRIRDMLPFNDDTIALFQEIDAKDDVMMEETKAALVGEQNINRLNTGGDTGVYWGRNYIEEKKDTRNKSDVVKDHKLIGQGKQQTMRYRYVRLKKENEITNAYSFHGYWAQGQENIENVGALILKILKACRGERVVMGGDLNLHVPALVAHLRNQQVTTHQVHLYYLQDYSDMSWPYDAGDGNERFSQPRFGNVDLLIEALPAA